MDARCQSFLFAHLFGNPAYLVGFTHNRISSEKFQLCVTFWGTACKVSLDTSSSQAILPVDLQVRCSCPMAFVFVGVVFCPDLI